MSEKLRMLDIRVAGGRSMMKAVYDYLSGASGPILAYSWWSSTSTIINYLLSLAVVILWTCFVCLRTALLSTGNMSSSTTNPTRPIVFMDINIGETPAGRLKMELFSDIVPK